MAERIVAAGPTAVAGPRARVPEARGVVPVLRLAALRWSVPLPPMVRAVAVAGMTPVRMVAPVVPGLLAVMKTPSPVTFGMTAMVLPVLPVPENTYMPEEDV